MLICPVTRNLHLGARSAFEDGREVGVADVVEAIELQVAGAQELKTSVASSGFVR
jgi:hypothetical protein